MQLPTQDVELRARLQRMFSNATDFFEWTPSKKEVLRQQAIVIDHLLTLFEEFGYRKGGSVKLVVKRPRHSVVGQPKRG